MRKTRGFTLIELMITVAVLGVLLAVGVTTYMTSIEKAKSTEALMNVSAIRTAETIHMASSGNFVAADNTAQINERLALNLEAKYYDYKVVGVTSDNFIIIAQRIGQDVMADNLPFSLAVIASDINGPMANGFGQYLNTPGSGGGSGGVGGGSSSGGTDSGGTTSGGNTNPFGLGGGTSSGGTSTGGGSGGAGGGGGGSSGGGSGGGSSGGGGGVTGGGPTGGGGSADSLPNDNLYNSSDLPGDIDLLKNVPASAGLIGFTSGEDEYNFIKNNGIQLVWHDMDPSTGAFWAGKDYNTIYVNSTFTQKSPAAIAAIVAHEATHASYDYNTDWWINYTETTDGVARADIHAPDNSIDQESHGMINTIMVWNTLKGGDINNFCQGWADVYARGGEAELKREIRVAYAGDPSIKGEYIKERGDV